MYLQIVAIFAFQAVGLHGQGFYGPQGARNGGLSKCFSANVPCRLHLEMRTLSGEYLESFDSQTCACRSPALCPSDMTLPDRVLSTYLISTEYNMTFKTAYCDPVRPKRVCQRGEKALTLSGYLLIPTDLDSYNCACNDGSPLRLLERRVLYYKYYQTYVCDSSVNACQRNQPCVTVRSDVSSYHCKCAEQAQCTVQGEWWPRTQMLQGYCTPQS
ncbi:hypothetical protein PoB_007508500 [Plakobranchus ocellatus]|uniref:Uncharacterized protein n=1 Tax=Plakobranchus ocellatus TaxID=259542 RepID=A0AAV4DWN9_9GAST|nr:hypothetical protein PoB_007508500 [Plakobranchus ocellatus]